MSRTYKLSWRDATDNSGPKLWRDFKQSRESFTQDERPDLDTIQDSLASNSTQQMPYRKSRRGKVKNHNLIQRYARFWLIGPPLGVDTDYQVISGNRRILASNHLFYG